jgi:hypothetical protein
MKQAIKWALYLLEFQDYSGFSIDEVGRSADAVR